MNKKIAIISQYSYPSNLNSYKLGRHVELALLFIDNGYQVDFFTSNFDHIRKIKKEIENLNPIEGLNLILIEEPGYSKNISVQRVISHMKLGVNLYRNLEGNYELIICSFPSISTAYFAQKHAKKNNTLFVLDVQDLWPESFYMAVPINFIFSPIKKIVQNIYQNSDVILTVSYSFENYIMNEYNYHGNTFVTYLGVNFKNNLVNEEYRTDDNVVKFGYIGNVSKSYDFKLIYEMFNNLSSSDKEKIELHIIGSGDDLEKVKKLFSVVEYDVFFYGRLTYIEALSLLTTLDIMINPIVKTSKSSIINKMADYSLLGKYVINSSPSEEYREYLEKTKSGVTIENAQEGTKVAENILKNKAYYLENGKNNYEKGRELFDRSITYPLLVDYLINNILGE